MHSGGGGEDDEARHLKNQVLSIAEALVQVTKEFIAQLPVEPAHYRELSQCALTGALRAADECAKLYKVQSPFR